LSGFSGQIFGRETDPGVKNAETPNRPALHEKNNEYGSCEIMWVRGLSNIRREEDNEGGETTVDYDFFAMYCRNKSSAHGRVLFF
jgi:hypothetical protein